MPKFLTQSEIYRILQRELPPDCYPDGAPQSFYSTADNFSVAGRFSDAYENLEKIYDNYFPLYMEDRRSDWEQFYFGTNLPDSYTLEESRAAIAAKARRRPLPTIWELLTLVVQYLPEGVYAQLAAYGCGSAEPWRLGVSLLGLNTYFPYPTSFENLGLDASEWCEFVKAGWRLGYSTLGVNTILSPITYEQLFEVQMNAYGYELRIFSYELEEPTLSTMLNDLNASEAFRSVRILKQNQSLSDYGLITIVNNVTKSDRVDCLCRDSASSTGYTGKAT